MASFSFARNHTNYFFFFFFFFVLEGRYVSDLSSSVGPQNGVISTFPWQKSVKEYSRPQKIKKFDQEHPHWTTVFHLPISGRNGFGLHLPNKWFGKGPRIEGWKRLIDVITRRKVRGWCSNLLHLPDVLVPRRLRSLYSQLFAYSSVPTNPCSQPTILDS